MRETATRNPLGFVIGPGYGESPTVTSDTKSADPTHGPPFAGSYSLRIGRNVKSQQNRCGA